MFSDCTKHRLVNLGFHTNVTKVTKEPFVTQRQRCTRGLKNDFPFPSLV